MSGRVGFARICTRAVAPLPLTVSPMIQRVNAIQQYPWTEGALYQVYTAPGQVTDIALQEGEQRRSVLMTRLVKMSGRVGFARICTRAVAPLPLTVPTRDGYVNAIQQYPWTEGALYQVYTAPGQVTDMC
jgi:type IV secretory pathway VirB9-like protein